MACCDDILMNGSLFHCLITKVFLIMPLKGNPVLFPFHHVAGLYSPKPQVLFILPPLVSHVLHPYISHLPRPVSNVCPFHCHLKDTLLRLTKRGVGECSFQSKIDTLFFVGLLFVHVVSA